MGVTSSVGFIASIDLNTNFQGLAFFKFLNGLAVNVNEKLKLN